MEKSFKKMNRCALAGKITHETFYSAARHVKSVAKKNGEGVGQLNIFRCKHCGGYHVGHDKRRN